MKHYDLRTTVGVGFRFDAENAEDAKTRLNQIVTTIASVEGVYETSLENEEMDYLVSDA